MILGTGIDIVDLGAFREQLADGASGFVVGTFTAGERADAETRSSGDPARHLAARFAAKEAFVKAWSGARWGQGPPMQDPARTDLREIEVVNDPFGRPTLALHGDVARWLAGAPGGTPRIHTSLSHDGGFACAMVVLEAAAGATGE